MIKGKLEKIRYFIKGIINKALGRKAWYKYYGFNNRVTYPNLTIYELVEKTSNSFPNYFAYEYYGKKVTYKDFIHQIKKVADSLMKIGVKENDRVTICMPNTPSAIIMFYAVNMVGATSSMIHPLSSESEIEFYLKESNSKYILTIDLVYDKVMNVINNTNIHKVIVSSVSDNMSNFRHAMYWFFSGRKNKIKKNEKAIFYSDLYKMGEYNKEFKQVKRKQDDEAVILYSGGTTGKPKGVVLTNRNFNALAIQSFISSNAISSRDSILSVLPIFHGFGLGVSIHLPLYVGMKVILIPNFSPFKFAHLIRKYKPNFLSGVPTLYEALLKANLGKKDLNSVKLAVCGGDTLLPSFKKEIDDYLFKHGSKTKVRCGYGLTECTGASCLNPEFEYKDNSIGIPYPGMLYKIVEIGTNKEVNINHDGEICICGPTVMKEYLNNEEETKKVLKKHKDGNIWLHTGDIGSMDEDGFIFFKQRLKRMIVSSGYNIYPSHMEEIINRHSLVKKSAVIGIEHPYKKQVVKVYIILKENAKATLSVKKDIKKYCEKEFVKYSWPYEYEYVNELPVTKIGKIDYKKLEETSKKL